MSVAKKLKNFGAAALLCLSGGCQSVFDAETDEDAFRAAAEVVVNWGPPAYNGSPWNVGELAGRIYRRGDWPLSWGEIQNTSSLFWCLGCRMKDYMVVIYDGSQIGGMCGAPNERVFGYLEVTRMNDGSVDVVADRWSDRSSTNFLGIGDVTPHRYHFTLSASSKLKDKTP